MFKNKVTRIKLIGDAEVAFDELQKTVDEELKKNIKQSIHQTILRSINRAIEIVKANPFAGTQVAKSQIPKKYIELYNAENLWKFDLSNFWRMIYTVHGQEVEITSFVLDVIDHNKYNEIFGYKNK